MKWIIFFIWISVLLFKVGWTIFSDVFYSHSYIHSRINLNYRLFQSDPTLYQLGIQGKIPYPKISTINNLDIYSMETTLAYKYISSGIERHFYFIGQSWYGDFLYATSGYSYTHRVNPLASYRHQLPFSVGGWVNNWEISFFGSMNWTPSTFHPLFGGKVVYLFYPHLQSENYFSSPSQRPLPHRVEILVYQTSKTSFGMKHIYQINLSSLSKTYVPHLLFSWEIFPLKVGMALNLLWRERAQIFTYTRYQPERGIDHSLDVGIMNYYHSFYLKQIPLDNTNNTNINDFMIESEINSE